MASKTLLTIEEFLSLDLPEDRKYELDEGEIVELTFPNPEHNLTVRSIVMLLAKWREQNPQVGIVCVSNMPYQLDAATLRGPDVSCMRGDRVRQIELRKPVAGSRDLAVEVVSPSDRRAAVHKKVTQYLEAGATEV
jgi:Uma2 family endonuclease